MEDVAESRFCVRRLEVSDNEKGFICLLSQLTVCPPVSLDEFRARFMEIEALGDDHVVCVVEDSDQGGLVATGSVFVERKFVRDCGKVGHIEDAVVNSAARRMRHGKRVIGFLSDHARSVGCYKVVLDCSPDNRGSMSVAASSKRSSRWPCTSIHFLLPLSLLANLLFSFII